MNYRKNFRLIGDVLLIESILLITPIVVAIVLHEYSEILPFVYTVVVTACLGFVLKNIPIKTEQILAKDGFFIVTMSWVVMSLIGAMPYIFSSHGIPNYVDALFETISGFTTTGSTILPDPSVLSKTLLFWRALTQWMGGMGVLVFMIALVPLSNDNSMHVLRAEMAGPSIDKIVPRTRDMAVWMYGIYTFLTLSELICLCISGVDFYDALLHTLTTAATGGFSTHSASIAALANPAAEWIITIFMFLFGINFNVFFLLIIRKFKKALKNEELWFYIALAIGSAIFIAYSVVKPFYNGNMVDAIRQSAFQVVSVMTTTGFTVTHSEQWPVFVQSHILFLMIFGACAGSTAGAIKLSRLIIIVKYMVVSLAKFVHPRSMKTVKQDGKTVPEEVIRGTAIFIILYFLLIMAGTFILSFGHDFISSISVAITAIGDNGIALGQAGANGHLADYSVLEKLVISFLMLAGRLEIYPVVVLLMPSTYKRK